LEVPVKRVVVSVAVMIGMVLSGAPSADASTGWQVQPVPEPGNSPILPSVSCPAKGNCTAVGFYHKNGVEYTLAEHWNGTSWHRQATPNPAGGSGSEAWFYGVSCPSPASCTVVGYHTPGPAVGGEQLLAEHWNGSRWALQHLPVPAGATESELYAVSCASTVNCTAVGQYSPASGPAAGGDLPLIEHWNGTSWRIQQVPFVKNATGLLGGVSCPTASDCVAVGTYGILDQNTNLFAERWNGSQWALQHLPTPAGTSFLLNSVSCPSAAACTTVGGAYNGTQYKASITEHWNGTSWSAQADATPAHTMLFGVSCPSGRSCTAVGEVAGQAGTAGVVAEHWSTTGWHRQAVPVPRGTLDGLYGVSCLWPQYCTATGDENPGGPLAAHEG
jgi:hypothetical protein